MNDDSENDGLAQGVLLLTPTQAAALCQVSLDRIYEWSREPGFPVIKEPHQLRIHARMFEDWLVKRATTGRLVEEEVAAA